MTSKLRLDLPILLPNILHDADACVGRLLAELRGQAGVEDAGQSARPAKRHPSEEQRRAA